MPTPKQGGLFSDLPPPANKPLQFKTQHRPLWTKNKAQLIERYLFYFVMITKHGAYIDGFAAPQDPKNVDSWACKLVLESKPQFLREFWLCDLNDDGYKKLVTLKEGVKRPRKHKVNVVQGDFNLKVHDILRESQIEETTAAFCLLDQRTFECDWDTVRAIAEHKKEGNKIEIFYFLASGWLDRSIAGTKKNFARLEKWWGNEDWRTAQKTKGHSRAVLVANRFKKELGYTHAYPWPIYEHDRGEGKVMFHMIHATDHDEAPKLMNRAYANATKARESIKELQMSFWPEDEEPK